MNPVESCEIRCPWCGRRQEIVVDATLEDQSYVEDCWACCRPMTVRILREGLGGEELHVSVEREGG